MDTGVSRNAAVLQSGQASSGTSLAPTVASASVEFDLKAWSGRHLARVEQALSDWVVADAPAGLGQAMRYSVLDGGKRLRPLLVLAANEAVHGNEEAALRAACAVELIHAYSLVHDDMPCMDDAALRRGKPTVHVKFGQAQALLAGDALQALAFELLVPGGEANVPVPVQAALCRLLARAAGHEGMAGGQAIDLASVGRRLNQAQLSEMHRRKTGALLQGSVMMGATCGVPDARAQAGLAAYGAAVGLAFQVVDDILDVTADSATLGKTAGSDAAQDKPTYVSLLGLERSAAFVQELLAQALQALAASGLRDVHVLRGLAMIIVNRVN